MALRPLLFALCLLPGWASAQTLCVFDTLGKSGPLYARMQDYALAARAWGASLDIRPYSDERIAAEDFKAGHCDAALLTGMRARQFNFFTGSIDSIGGLPDYPSLKLLIETLARSQSQALLQSGESEIGGLLPLGAAYLFLRDRRINSVEKVAGRKLAVLAHDPAQARMAERLGALPVSTDVSSFAGKFNNGSVDMIAAPAVAYLPLELYRGVGARGVVLKLPLAQLTFQLVLRSRQFPTGFGLASRQYFLGQFDAALQQVRAAEDEILFFFPPPDGEAPRYHAMMREARIALTQDGLYDPKMMRLMKKVRCRLAPEQAECSDARE